MSSLPAESAEATPAPAAISSIDPEDQVLTAEELQYAPLIAKLREWNLAYRIDQEFPLDQVERAKAAQVRSVANIAPSQRVEEFRQQMANGALFPPVLLRETGGNPLLIDGNTRLAAAKKIGRKTFPAIIVDTRTPTMARILAAAVNQMGGERLQAAEAHEAAILMMQNDYPDSAIGRELGRDLSQVRRWRSQQEVLKRADALGLTDQINTLSAGAQRRLVDVRHDEPFVELTRLFADVRPNEKQAREMVAQIVSTTSDEAASQVVRELREELAPAGPPPHAANRRSNLIPLTHAAMSNLLKLAGRPHEGFDPANRVDELARWRQIRALCDEMLGALGGDDVRRS
jgi:ParB-like chromosome segregation protein Spo0J